MHVVSAALDDQQTARLVARRTLLPAIRHLLRIAPPGPMPLARTYWPISLINSVATIKLPFRRSSDVRIAGAVDAVTGRPGLVDVELLALERREAGGAVVIPERFDEEAVRARWREFFRNYVVHKYRPSAIERLGIVQLRCCYLPYRVVVDGKRVYLVDELMHRVDPLDQLPDVAPYFMDTVGAAIASPAKGI